MKVVVVVQARLASTRLPAKILLDLGGKTALEQCLSRACRFDGIAEVVVATSDTPPDDVVAAVARRHGHRIVRGSEHDVLSRFTRAAEETGADAVVRCTSDCPLLDPAVSSLVIRRLLSGDADYVSNVLERRLPRGLDTEAFSRDALNRANRDANASDEREHVTLHFYRRPDQFRLASALPPGNEDLSVNRWTLDTVDDYRFLHAVFERLGSNAANASMADVLALVAADPRLAQINAHVGQKPVEEVTSQRPI